MERTFFLVDGTALAYRSHFAFINNPLRNSKGEETSATFGYVRAILEILEHERPDRMAVAFDVSRDTFRKKMYAAYKATRQKAPRELKAQFGWIKEITGALGIPVLEREGYEADDLIGTAARLAEERGYEVRIVSNDKDMMQLVGEHVLIYDSGRIIDADAVREKFGVEPERLTDVLGLMGDSSDNVPGVPLVGPKKASTLVRKFGSLEEVLARAPAQKPSKTQQNLIEFAGQARLSKKLVTIDTAAPVELPEGFAERDRKLLARRFLELEFRDLHQQVANASRPAERGPGYEEARDIDALQAALLAAPAFSFALQTTGPDPYANGITRAEFCWKTGHAVHLPWSGEAAFKLKPVFEEKRIAKAAHDLKFAYQVLASHGIALRYLAFDPSIASYLLDNERDHRLDALALRHLGRQAGSEPGEAADLTFRLVEFFRPRLEDAGVRALFEQVEMPLVRVLADMERAGVRIDTHILEELSAEFEESAHRLVTEIHDLAGEVFNVGSPKQLGPILFEKLEIQSGTKKRLRRTKTGAYSTDAATLEAYCGHPIVAKLLEYRAVTKLKSTYVDALPSMVHPKSGRIHSSFNQTVAVTGRLSSESPNLQNIPIRTELGRRIRRAFGTEEGWRLLSADYNQIELRLMAHLSGDEGLRAIYQGGGGDVHTETAARMFDVEREEVTREQRSRAKAINFGILYGMGPMRLSRALKISLPEARAFLEAYFREFPRVREFQKDAVERARAEGYVTTLLGRRRAIPQISSRDPGVRANAENMAKNTPVQGTAADLIKVAMIAIHRRLEEDAFEGRMILQVHDELVFEAPADETERLSKMVRAEMAGALELKVPIVVEVGIGRDWLEAH